MTALVATLFLSACDKTPVVVNVPAETVAVPGPAGPAGKAGEQGVDGNKGDMGVRGNTGDTGAQGYEGTQGETGETGKSGGTTVIITPPPAESAPAN